MDKKLFCILIVFLIFKSLFAFKSFNKHFGNRFKFGSENINRKSDDQSNSFEQHSINYNDQNISDYYELPDEQRLIYETLYMYDSAARPVFNASKSVNLKFGISLIQICDLVNKN